MDPPSYDQVNILSIGAPSSQDPSEFSPSCDKVPSAPPPSYGETVNQPYPYPILTLPTHLVNVQPCQSTPVYPESAHAQRVQAESAHAQRAQAESAYNQRAQAESAYNQRAQAESAYNQRVQAESAHNQRVQAERAHAQRVHAENVQIQSVHTETVHSHQPVVIQMQPAALFADVPCRTRCPYCHQDVTTQVVYRPGVMAWAMCILFTVLGLICGCCLIPFLVNGFQDAHHSCPSCHAHIHTTQRK